MERKLHFLRNELVKAGIEVQTFSSVEAPDPPSESRSRGKNALLIIIIREKAFREMKKDVGMTTAQKSKETRRMESLFCISSQQSLHVRTLATTL